MRQVLMENAFEAWAAAIRFCDDIKGGKCTLQYQKSFVSSLHNAVELFMKQMMLNNNDHDVVVRIRDCKTTNAHLKARYDCANDLNGFFKSLSQNELAAFYTIGFDGFIKKHQAILGTCLSVGDTIEDELNLLQQLRNGETHFAIHQGSFLSESDFCSLYNFMICFYKILDSWRPNDKEDYELRLLPYWGNPVGADSIYGFEREQLKGFTYRAAVKNSPLANEIAEVLSGDWLYGAPDFSSFSIAKELVEVNPQYTQQFNDIWALVYMMQSFGMIIVDEILDDEQAQVHFTMNVSIQ